MRHREIKVLIAAALLFSLSELFPPWLYEDEDTSGVRSAGYHFYRKPPKVGSPEEMRAIFSYPEGTTTQFIRARIDYPRLDGQRATLICLTLGLLLLLNEQRLILNRVLGPLFIFAGLFFLGLLTWYVVTFP